jgi:hypothetical protein
VRGLSDLFHRVAVSVGEDSLQTIDLVLLGVLSGQWLEFERELRIGLALADAHGDTVTREVIRAEATLFRYERNLISATEFRQWLEVRGLSTGDVSEYLRRLVLRRERRDVSVATTGGDEVAAVIRAETLCDGILAQLMDDAVVLLAAGQMDTEPADLASLEPADPASLDPTALDPERSARAVLAAGSLDALRGASPGPEELRARVLRLASLEDCARRVRDQTQASLIANRIRDHALDWLELTGERLTFTREGAAREARLLLRDGETPARVSERAGTPALDHRLLVGQAPAGLTGFFAAAAIGDVVGPWEQDGRWHVMQVLAKQRPSPEQQQFRERATDELYREAVERHAAGRTIRHVAV